MDIRSLLQTDQVDNFSLMPTIESGSSVEISPCPSPTPNVARLSPMPDLRRDSQAEELLTLPAPDGFADSRRNSENILRRYFFHSHLTLIMYLYSVFKILNSLCIS